jgi:hypothetical protein
MKKLIGALLVLLMLGGWHMPPDPHGMTRIYAEMVPDDVHVTYDWEECGTVNAYYSIGPKHVTMCKELETVEHPIVGFVFAHELAHAVIIQQNIPFSGSGEVAADELAAITLIGMGRGDEVFAAGEWFYEMGRPEDPTDEHAGHERRGLYLMCLAAQAEGMNSPLCYVDYARTKLAWERLTGKRV